MTTHKELSALSHSDLRAKLEGNLVKLLNIRLQLRQGKQVKTHMFAKLRREVARIKTVLNEKRES